MRLKRLIAFSVIGLGAAFASPGPVFSWDNHDQLIPWTERALSPAAARLFSRLRAMPREATSSTSERYLRIADDLTLNPRFALPAFPAVRGVEIFANEPDDGMDSDLPDSADPRNLREFMGGKTGPTSQGFRHMYFSGWSPSHPLTTFQIPTYAIGEAPVRTQVLATYARSLLRSTGATAREDHLWGLRVLLWAVHYVQDLAQPFHSVQIPSLRFVPWSAALAWPPSRGFDRLIEETTRTMGNYHFAYEAQAALEFSRGLYDACLKDAVARSTLRWDPAGHRSSPKDLALAVADSAIELAPRLAAAQLDYYGTSLMEPGVDVPDGKGAPDYRALAADPRRDSARRELEAVTCEGYANAVTASKFLIEWALQ